MEGALFNNPKPPLPIDIKIRHLPYFFCNLLWKFVVNHKYKYNENYF